MPAQIADVASFLSAHDAEFVRLLTQPGVEGACLDFGWEIPCDAGAQFNRWPISLMGSCARIGLDLEVSVLLVEPRGPSG